MALYRVEYMSPFYDFKLDHVTYLGQLNANEYDMNRGMEYSCAVGFVLFWFFHHHDKNISWDTHCFQKQDKYQSEGKTFQII